LTLVNQGWLQGDLFEMDRDGCDGAGERKRQQVKGYKAVIFDLDGTLLDTLKDLALSMNRTLEALGLPQHPLDAYRYFVGEGATILVTRALPESMRSPEKIEEARELFFRDYARHWMDNTGPYPGIPELIEALAGRDLALGVLSNKPHDFTVACVERFLEPERFRAVWGERRGIPRKPDPAGALAMAEQLGASPEECIYVGDTAIDMKTATGAGMFPVGVLWGFRDEAELKDSGAKELISEADQLLDLL